MDKNVTQIIGQYTNPRKREIGFRYLTQGFDILTFDYLFEIPGGLKRFVRENEVALQTFVELDFLSAIYPQRSHQADWYRVTFKWPDGRISIINSLKSVNDLFKELYRLMPARVLKQLDLKSQTELTMMGWNAARECLRSTGKREKREYQWS